MQPPKYTKNILSGNWANSNNTYYSQQLYTKQYGNSKNGLCYNSKAQYSQSACKSSRFCAGRSGAIILHCIELSIHNNAPPV